MKHYQQAVAAFNRVLELQPNNYWGWYNRAVVLDEIGRKPQADIS